MDGNKRGFLATLSGRQGSAGQEHRERKTAPGSLREKEVLRKGPLVVDPLRIAAEAGALRHFRDFFGFVFVGTFGPNRFVLVENDTQVGRGNAHALPARDRKSTRLNSSHTVSSYAVFCLKKKIATSSGPFGRVVSGRCVR